MNGGPALFRLVRFWSRRWVNRATEELPGELRQVQHIQAVEAVHAADGGAREATVSTVAHQLGLDHSGASRIVRDATAAGYLLRAESEQDRRRAVLLLTPRGEQLLADSHRWQRRVFTELTASWSERDREQFAAYLRRLAGELGV